MIEVHHVYSLTPEWQEGIIKQTGGELIGLKRMVFPREIADGECFFTQVAPGLSAVLLDLNFNQPIRIRRQSSDESLYIIHYDFSDEINLIHINGKKHKIGYKANLGLGVIDNNIENIFEPAVGERIFALRLLVSKELLSPAITARNSAPGMRNATLFFHDHIDSRSKIILHAIKNRSLSDPTFEIHLKSTALKLLAKFIERYTNLMPLLHQVSEPETEALNITKDYLMHNLFSEFPGLPFLAEKAGMSISKYKGLFKKMYIDTPNNFFIREKMLLARVMLKSQKYKSLTDVIHQLGYSKLSYFSSSYYKHFKRRAIDDFDRLE